MCAHGCVFAGGGAQPLPPAKAGDPRPAERRRRLRVISESGVVEASAFAEPARVTRWALSSARAVAAGHAATEGPARPGALRPTYQPARGGGGAGGASAPPPPRAAWLRRTRLGPDAQWAPGRTGPEPAPPDHGCPANRAPEGQEPAALRTGFRGLCAFLKPNVCPQSFCLEHPLGPKDAPLGVRHRSSLDSCWGFSF